MKICIVIASLSGGGAEFVAREWARGLSKRGHSVTVAITKKPEATFEPNGFDIEYLAGGTPIAHVRKMRRLIRRENFDIVLGLLPYFNFLAVLGARWQRNRPKIGISGRNVEVPFPNVHGTKVFTMRVLGKILYPLADSYLAISHPVAAEAGALYRVDSDRIVVVPNPATAKCEIRLNTSNRARTQATLNLIVPARIAEQKRPILVLSVALELQKRGHNVAVHFFGDGPLRADVEACGKKLGVSVIIHGWDEKWFTNAPDGVVILTSLAEGFGNVFVEAASVGLPSVVSSRCLGAADAVVPGVTGAFAAYDSPSDFADAVETASQLTMNQEIVNEWLDRFSVENSLTAVENFLTRTKK